MGICMDYLYKLTVEIDDDKVLRLQRHDLGAVYQTVRDAFAGCNFQEQSQDDRELIFTIGEGKDSFSEVGIVANSLYDSWLGPYLKDGKVTVLCPKCKNAPKVILNGNRTIVKCSCGYILDAEIYL